MACSKTPSKSAPSTVPRSSKGLSNIRAAAGRPSCWHPPQLIRSLEPLHTAIPQGLRGIGTANAYLRVGVASRAYGTIATDTRTVADGDNRLRCYKATNPAVLHTFSSIGCGPNIFLRADLES